MFRYFVASLSVLFLTIVVQADAPSESFVIHEWGTFTVLQDEQGNALPGVNIDEEPLPSFVHRLHPGIVKPGLAHAPILRTQSKGIPTLFSGARMRMETPIIYLYPPDDQPQNIDISVGFQGGWISEWFPDAEVDAPGFDNRRGDLGELAGETSGTIRWNNVQVNADADIVETDKHVWLAPRAVSTPTLKSTDGEAEKYLFYRGVANIDAPLRVVRSDDQTLDVRRNHSLGDWERSLPFSGLWLVDIRQDGAAAFRKLEIKHDVADAQRLVSTAATFADDDYSQVRLTQLRASMRGALVDEGLFEDEAEAMLQTWELSYFKSPGLRLFFTLPREWTDRVLPMTVSRQSKIERVMIGRVEIITPRQRELLRLINTLTVTNPVWFSTQLAAMPPERQAAVWQSLSEGSKRITDFGFEIPEDYAAFLQLGRFRESLVANGAKENELPQLVEFALRYRISLR